MIQRIQTLFLVVAAVAFGGMLTLPFASTPAKIASGLFSDGFYSLTDQPVLMALAILGVVLAVVAIFLFKKRPAQLKLGYAMIALSIVIPLIAYLFFSKQSGEMAANIEVNDELGMFLPFASLAAAILANVFIRKDEKLVKSMDRLR